MITLQLVDVSTRVDPGGPPVLDHVDVALAAGTLTALQGRSGSGKTTLLDTVLGWRTPTSGHVRLAGYTGPLPDAPWPVVAVVPQAPSLLPELTVAENLEVATRFTGRPAAWDPADLLERLDLSRLAARPADRISLGEQQRCAVARALVVDPAVLLADEPLASQDAGHARAVLATLAEACRRGAACLVASHDPLVLDWAGTVLRLEDGHLRSTPGPVRET